MKNFDPSTVLDLKLMKNLLGFLAIRVVPALIAQ